MRQTITLDDLRRLQTNSLYQSDPSFDPSSVKFDRLGQSMRVSSAGAAPEFGNFSGADDGYAGQYNPRNEIFQSDGNGGFTGYTVTPNADGTFSSSQDYQGNDWKGFSKQFEDSWMDKLTEAGVKAFLATAVGNVAGGFMGGGAGAGGYSGTASELAADGLGGVSSAGYTWEPSGLLGTGAEAGMTFTGSELGLDTLPDITNAAITAGKPAADAAIAAQTAGAFTVPATSGGGLLDTVKNFATDNPAITKALVSGAGGLLGAASTPSGDMGGGASNVGPGGYQFDPARYQFTRNNFGRI